MSDDAFKQWFTVKNELELAVDVASSNLRQLVGDTRGGLVSDSVKFSEPYQVLKSKYNRAFKTLRDFNGAAPKGYLHRASLVRRGF